MASAARRESGATAGMIQVDQPFADGKFARGIFQLSRNPSLRLYVKAPDKEPAHAPARRRSARLAALSVPAFSDDKKKDVNEIGNRDVGKGINFYSIEKEIALGKQLAEEVERQARMFNDPLIGEYVNRICQKPGAELRCQGAGDVQSHRRRRSERLRLARRVHFRPYRAAQGRPKRKPNWRVRWPTRSRTSRRGI